MSTTVTYEGGTIATVNNNTKTLQTAGKYLTDDITLVDVSGDGAVSVHQDENGYLVLAPSGDGFAELDEDADVCFWDYDGTLVYSYTFGEIAQMTELPPPPDHSNDRIPLTFQYWNWDLADLKALTYPMDVGAVYYPTDGKMRWTYRLNNRTGLTCSFTTSQTTSITINWGDGTPDELWGTNETNGANPTHTYSAPGTYECTWTGDGRPSSRMRTEGNDALVGTFYVGGSGNNTVWLSAYWANAFEGSSLEYVIGYTRSPENGTFSNMPYLKAFVFGKGFTWTGQGTFRNSRNMKICCFSSSMNDSNANTTSEYLLTGSAVKRVRLPSSFICGRFFLQEARILEFFNGDASYYRNCKYCYGLRRVVIKGNINSEVFYGCPIEEIWCGLDEPPTLGSVDCFNKMLTSAKIHVKATALTAFQTATNWSTYAGNMVGDWTANPDR